ncbi:hypothetical protein [Dactylosporangium sp. CS-033363]|uniref:hypothetical protein n=1 Tax=Dactylosporangium sp. CS-033363 TaxID=3239935 RepID=UPI003D94EAF0
MLRRAGIWVRDTVFSENADLYVMAAAALVFTILGATGVTGLNATLSMTLAVLAGLAISMIRTRRHVAQLAAAAAADPLGVLRPDFPQDLPRRRVAARDLLFVGLSMSRTSTTSAAGFRALLARGGRIRVLMVDPTDDAAVAQAAGRRGVEALRARILASLETLAALDPGPTGSLEVRVSRTVPGIGVNAIDAGTRDGLVVVQHYEYRAPEEPAPIMRFTVQDSPWYRHFLDEAERLWADGQPWPRPPGEDLDRHPRPVFAASFGPELAAAIGAAEDLFVVGVARNTFLTGLFSTLQRRLAAGARMRFLVLDPDSPALAAAAERHYADRDAASMRARIEHSLRLLRALSERAEGRLEVRVTGYPPAVGIVATDLAGEGRRPAVFAEYFAYRIAEDPKFALTASDGWVFETFTAEAEALWAAARALDFAE